MTTTNKEKIKIFISYGHKESKIFKKVVAYLREKGYEVWFDESSIKGTDDWRQEIVEGIRESQTVIAGLSHDFLKEGGVCSEEMGIALAIKSNRIFTIYLDKKEDLKKIPSTMTRSQYINLSDWKKYIDDDQAFDQWFKKEFQPIIDRIESKDNKEFSGQINTIRHALRIPEIESNKVNSYLIKKYTKRPWIDEKLEKWRKDPQGEKIGVIYGKQGTGKSHYAAIKCHTDYHVAANFFCEYNKENFSTNKSLIRDLAFQLACQIPDYRTALLYQLESIAITKKKINKLGFEELVDDGQIHIREDYSEEEEFDNLIVRPLSISIDGKIETHLILIDALDEAGKEERSRLIDIIVNHLDRLPRWIRILILTRPEADIKPYLTDAFEIDLDKESNKKDIKIYLEETFEKENYPNKDEIINAIVEKSQGTFLYAELVGKEILGGSLSIEDIDKLPKGLARYFSSWFKRIYPIEKIDENYKEKDRKAIAMILASPRPIPKEELNNLLGWEFSQTNDFVKKLENYLTINEDVEGKETIEIAHKYMADWLLSDLAGDYKVYKEDGLSYIYKGIEELYMLDKDLDSLTRYEKINLIDALNNQRGKKALKDFLNNKEAKDELLDFAYEEKEYFRVETASKLYDDMIDLYKDDEENILYYSISANGYFYFLYEIGKEEKSKKIIKEVIKKLEDLLLSKDDIEYKEELANSYNNLGILYEPMKRYEESEIYHKKAIDLRENLIEVRNYLSDISDLASSYNNLGALYQSMQRYEDSEIYYKKSIELCEELKKSRNSLTDISNLATFYNNLGSLYRSMQRYYDAEIYLKKAMELYEELKKSRNFLNDISDLANSYGNLGALYKSIQRYEESEIYLKKTIDSYEELKESRKSLTDISNLVRAYNNIGYLYGKMKKYEDSEISLKKSIELYEELKESRNSLADVSIIASIYNNLGGLYKSIHRYEDAEFYCKEAISLLEDIPSNTKSYEDKKNIVSSINVLSEVYFKKNKLGQARKLMEKILKYQKLLVEKRNGLEEKRDLAIIYENLGALYSNSKGRKTEEYLLEAKMILEDLYRKSPDREILEDLIELYERVSEYYESRGKYKKAEDYKKKSEDLLNPNSKAKGNFNILDVKKLEDLL
ncbi:toll/interleukin-1 receptor domain-containing protein [Anaerococcus sp. Marseille-P9784]|uniref:toll/interleukin-1 receptor domain-containing protein n=1 Tax=Anaerococcus sp. Marseille-P9784 TaxID=2614127 RepID=UPI00124A43C8|nr:toll/interleukin-1 receptor domain-containing protein [Anaerococcus sp. Marseille-P9784]